MSLLPCGREGKILLTTLAPRKSTFRFLPPLKHVRLVSYHDPSLITDMLLHADRSDQAERHFRIQSKIETQIKFDAGEMGVTYDGP